MPQSVKPPQDIVAVDSGNKSYMFYVNSNNQLAYLESPDETGEGDFTVKKVKINDDPIEVSTDTKQVAAITWNTATSNTKEIRVYYVNDENKLKEACKTGDNPWVEGELGGKGQEQQTIVKGSSISATVHSYGNNAQWNLRVFASKEGNHNLNGVAQISVFKFLYNEKPGSKGHWNPNLITNGITTY